MADSKKSALEFLDELKTERDELNALIQGLEKRLGVSTMQQLSNLDEEETPRGATPRDAAFTPEVGFFHNLSQAAAAEKLLKINPGRAYTTGQILEAFRSSGMPLNPKNSVQILYTALKRSPKFERVGGKAWGLTEWYPEKKKRANVDRLDNLPDPSLVQDEEGHSATKRTIA
jgi:hypothetical protein